MTQGLLRFAGASRVSNASWAKMATVIGLNLQKSWCICTFMFHEYWYLIYFHLQHLIQNTCLYDMYQRLRDYSTLKSTWSWTESHSIQLIGIHIDHVTQISKVVVLLLRSNSNGNSTGSTTTPHTLGKTDHEKLRSAFLLPQGETYCSLWNGASSMELLSCNHLRLPVP